MGTKRIYPTKQAFTVSFWHEPDLDPCTEHVRFQGVEQTSKVRALMLATDPTRTLRMLLSPVLLKVDGVSNLDDAPAVGSGAEVVVEHSPSFADVDRYNFNGLR